MKYGRTAKIGIPVALAAALVAGWCLTGSSHAAGPGTQAPPPSAPTEEVSRGLTRLQVDPEGIASFLIDAPLEKIKGRASRLRGSIDVDWNHLESTTGQIEVDLDSLKTMTFGDASKDDTQTEHAHNWLGLGSDATERNGHRYARFTIRSVRGPRQLSEKNAGEFVAEGDLWVHGITAKKTVLLSIEATGPVSAPTSLRIKTKEPLRLSLSEHDVKPRDVAGKFLSGALEKVGKKIDDSVQVTLDLTLTPLRK